MITLAEVTSLAQEYLTCERKVAEIERELAAAKEVARCLREESIPSAMMELGLSELTLRSGEKLKIKQEVFPSIPPDRKNEAYDWLERNGFGGLIKTQVNVQFGKGEVEKAAELYERLNNEGMLPTIARDVHYQTLRAFLREQMREQAETPWDLFGARPVWTSTIK